MAKQTLRGHSAGVVAVAFAPDGNMIATASRDRTVKHIAKENVLDIVYREAKY
ncbi:MAG: hypothetical protein F6K24_45860 [Okeania sp. SIO2D1]|nr:hypothetical protein [Okeania sp. SIO2D1]